METRDTKPASALAALNLPPTFVTDHCVRTLSYPSITGHGRPERD